MQGWSRSTARRSTQRGRWVSLNGRCCSRSRSRWRCRCWSAASVRPRCRSSRRPPSRRTSDLGGLGRYLIDGQAYRDYPQMVSGSVLVIALALIADGVFVGAQRLSHLEGEIMRLRHITLARRGGPQPGRLRRRPDEAVAARATRRRSRSGRLRSRRTRSSPRSTPRRSRPRASTVKKKLNIGAREVYIPALKNGEIDLIPGVHRQPADVSRSQGDGDGARAVDVRRWTRRSRQA